jgi:trehalose/maltose hydrolase-like predicted phosphorylase
MNAWHLTYDGFDPVHQGHREALCTLGNGFMATRGALAESIADGIHYPGTYVAGIYNRLASEVNGRAVEHESIVNLPNWLPLSFRPAEGSWSEPSSTKLLEHRQVLDMSGGVLHRKSRLVDVDDRCTVVSERRIVSMDTPHLAAIEQTITPENWSGRFEVRATLDGRVTNSNVAEDRLLANQHLIARGEGGGGGEHPWLEVETSASHIRVAVASRVRFRSSDGRPTVGRQRIAHEPKWVAEGTTLEATEGRPIVVEKVASMWTTRDSAQSDPLTSALADVHNAPRFQQMLRDHVRAWEHVWERFRLDLAEADDAIALLVRLHAFHLLQTLSPHIADLDVGVPARGLHGEAYRGHIFWDELFAFPLLNLHSPELARALLLYRARRLPAARRAALDTGSAGARFPWQSGADGTELTPTQLWNPRSRRWMPDNSRRQHHVGLAVAWNVWQYFQATGDERFLADHGIEILVEVARFWAGLATPASTPGRFDIRGVMGPDEYHDGYPDRPGQGIDNNAYTNVLASWLFQRVVEVRTLLCSGADRHLWERLDVSDAEIEWWGRLGRELTVPLHGGIIGQFEGWERLEELDWERYRGRYGNIGRLDLILEAEGDSTNRYKLAKQADALMLFYLFSAEELTALLGHLGYDFDPANIAATVEHYLARTAHGSTLSHLVHAWVVARSDRGGSWDAFRQSLAADIADTQGGTTAEGIHLGAMAGGLDILQRCYAGLEVRADALWLAPRLPDGLASVAFDLTYRGHVLSLSIDHSRLEVRTQACAASPIQLVLAGRAMTLSAGETVGVPLVGDQDGELPAGRT